MVAVPRRARAMDELIADFLALARETPVEVRFIERMPIGCLPAEGYVSAEGVRERILSLPGVREARFDLLDLQGRVRSTLELVSSSILDAVFPGSAALSPGVYFVRGHAFGSGLMARVVVVR